MYRGQLVRAAELQPRMSGNLQVRMEISFLNCSLFNVRSLMNKIDYLHSFIHLNNPDLLFATESWMREKIRDSEIVGGLPFSCIDLTEVDEG